MDAMARLDLALAARGAPRRAAACALAALACAACAFPGPSKRPERAFAIAPPAGWRRIAVLPFDGAPELRRPAEELLAVRIRAQDRVAVVPPFPAGRALAELRAGGVAPSVAAWIVFRVDAASPLEAPPAPTAEEIRAVAARLAVDGVVAGAVRQDPTWIVPPLGIMGAIAEVELFDGTTGAPVAVVRRHTAQDAARGGLHEAAMSATSRAADALLIVLGTPFGSTPDLSPGPEPAPEE
jgi:hypothetical protein